jgi:major vault protein
MAVETRGNDLVLTTGQFAYLLDRTKGNVINYVGPSKTSMSETDVPVIWDAAKRSFAFCDMKEAIKPFICAGENDYIVLQNPADDKKDEHPKEATGNNLARLNMGRTINIRGPAWFALWPGQEAKVVPGHTLRSNQFLIVQVSNDEAAKENWAKAVIKPQVVVEKVPPPNAQQPEPNAHGAKADEAASTAGSAPQALASQLTPSVQNENKPPANLSIGQRFVIAGKAVSFYIPPTGLEVVPDEKDSLVRDAVSLEQLEYCILLDENGEKKVITGPAVVFPEPTQTFLEIDSKRKFRAIELNQLMAIHVKVIAPYKEGDKEIKAGEELFITGKEQAIYFPRPEHAIIKHGDQLIHYAVAIPAGEARYVLGRETGSVRVIKGPTMLLPDARKEVIARRVLDSTQVQLWYPGNNRAKQVNEELAVAAQSSGGLAGLGRMLVGQATAVNAFTTTQGSATDFSAGEQLSRKTSFTPPRAITLDNKFDGVVTVEVWNGYAVLVVSKTGKRDVVQGPKSILLEFDETLMPVEFSTGTPKSAERSIKTVFLRTLNNRVSDAVSAETSDLVGVNIQLSYRVNFEGDKSKWFDVENYIQFLCDHTRSLIRNMVRKHGIQAFQQNYIDLIRDVILGVPSEKDKSRSGRNFVENGMRIYDVKSSMCILVMPRSRKIWKKRHMMLSNVPSGSVELKQNLLL